MSTDRIDELFSEALATGAIPAGATAAERTELEQMLLAASALRASRTLIDVEARATMPVARARFERFVAESGAPAPGLQTERASRGSLLGWLFGVHRALATAATAAGLAIVAVLALVVSQNVFTGVETASAQVLIPGDYVQVEGVVSDASVNSTEGNVTVQSEFGPIRVALSSVTSVVNDETQKDLSAVKKGDAVLISGLVRQDRSIAAHTLAVAAQSGTPPKKVAPKLLSQLKAAVEGRIVLVSLAEDEIHGSVLLDIRGEKFIVPIGGKAVRLLLQYGSTPLGARVTVSQEPGAPAGTFSIQVVGQGQPGALTPAPGTGTAIPTIPANGTGGAGAAPTHFTGVRGVVTGRAANVLQVESARGQVNIVVRPETRLVLADSGLIRDAIVRGETAVGHEVTISGAIVGERVIADVIVFGPKVTR